MTTGHAYEHLRLARFVGWRVRRGSKAWRFSDGLVVQRGFPGELELRVCRVCKASRGALGLLGPLAAACTSEGVRRDTGIVSWLHWPNLVTVDGRVIAKTSLTAASPPYHHGRRPLVFGISVNCFAPAPVTRPPELRETSILEVLGVEIELDLLRDKILHALEWYYAEWERGMHRKLVERISPTIPWLGRDVEVRLVGDGQVLTGRASGLDDNGSLLLHQRECSASKKISTLHPENVELVREIE